MNRRQSISTLASAALAVGALASSAAYADLPKAQQVNVKDMDANKNGRIEKDEYLAYMSRMFDAAAGSKGYCTFQEVVDSMRQLNNVHHGA
jgi:hypothetical protein